MSERVKDMTDIELRLWQRKFDLTDHEVEILKLEIETGRSYGSQKHWGKRLWDKPQSLNRVRRA